MRVTGVEIVRDNVIEGITDLSDEDAQSGYTDVILELEIVDGEREAFDPKFGIDYRLADAAGKEPYTLSSIS